MIPYHVEMFGSDCLGNKTGYRVVRRFWSRSRHSARQDGMMLKTEIAGSFVANIYEEGSDAKALSDAECLCAWANKNLIGTQETA